MLCCLKYGDVWGIDETEIEIRGSAKEPDASIMEKFKEQHGHLEKSDPKTYKNEWEKARERSERSAHVSIKRWLTGVIDHKTRVIIHHIINRQEARSPRDIQTPQSRRERGRDPPRC